MNIFTAAAAGLAIVIKKIGIGFKAVLTGTKILIVSAINFVLSVITAIVNAILSAIKWVMTQIVNLIHFLFRTYLRLECGCVPPVQKFAGLMIRLRWGFVIVSVLYAVYQYLGIKALVVAIVVCGGLVAIGYSEAEKGEEEWNVHLDKLNSIIAKYLKYLIRLAIMAFSVYSLHLMFHNNIVTFSAAAILILIIVSMQLIEKGDRKYENEQQKYFIDKLPSPNGLGIDKECFAVTPQAAGYQTKGFAIKVKTLFIKQIFPVILAVILLLGITCSIIYISYNLYFYVF